MRAQTDATRITPTLLTSPFRIAQDLLSLDGFAVQQLGWGVNFERGRGRLGLTVAVENLTNAYLSRALPVRTLARTKFHHRHEQGAF